MICSMVTELSKNIWEFICFERCCFSEIENNWSAKVFEDSVVIVEDYILKGRSKSLTDRICDLDSVRVERSNVEN